jgi:epoxyqueuosine reductase
LQNTAPDKHRLTALIRDKALQQGFYACGISPAHVLSEDKIWLEHWLENKGHGEMSYMQRNRPERADPSLLVEDARSVISVVLLYNTRCNNTRDDILISKYAWAKDYHILLKAKLNNIISFLKELMPRAIARACADSSPVFEKRWAQQAGLGWRGKHTILVNREAGSFFFLGEIITNIEFDYDEPSRDHCGNCTRCVDACPTGALAKPYRLDARKCIAYHTIENKHDDPDTPVDPKKYIFGCDICQDACPWNQNNIFNSEMESGINHRLLQLSPEDWLHLTEEEFGELTKDSCIRRTGLPAMKRNVRHALKK